MTKTRDAKGRFASKKELADELNVKQVGARDDSTRQEVATALAGVRGAAVGSRVQPTSVQSGDLVAKAVSGKLAGGRTTLDQADTFYGPFKTFVPPLNSEDQWRLLDLDNQALSHVTPWQLIEYLSDLSPDFSKAVWDFLRFCNPGWDIKVFKPGGDVASSVGQDACKGFIDLLTSYYGSFDVVINRLFISAYLRGAFMAELVLDPSAVMPVDLVTPDPQSVRFERQPDPIRGNVWVLGQVQYKQGFVPLTRPTVKYVPVDPLPGVPYGRAPGGSALFSTMFLLGMLHDLKRVVSQQGYPRLDITIDLEKLAEAIPQDISSDPEAFKAWVDGVTAEVQRVYASLQPDDAYIHTSVVSVNRPVSAIDSRSLGSVDNLINMLERMTIRGLKSMPILMGLPEGGSEAAANRQWEIHLAGIRSLQHLCETLLEHIFAIALQAQGIPADVQFRFAELRASEALRDAQTEQLKIGNALAKFLNGWIDQDAASIEITGHPAVEPEPLVMPTSQSFAERGEEQISTTPVPAGPGNAADGTQTPAVDPNAVPGDNENQSTKTSSAPRGENQRMLEEVLERLKNPPPIVINHEPVVPSPLVPSAGKRTTIRKNIERDDEGNMTVVSEEILEEPA